MSRRTAEADSGVETLLSKAQIARRVDTVAARVAPALFDDTVAVVLLLGGLWFAADLTRALAARGRPTDFDALWLSSYGDGQIGAGACVLRAGLQRPIKGRHALIVDDVFDSGVSLAHAVGVVRDAGARAYTTVVFARKPWPTRRALEPDFVAWDAPSRFMVGYGMDAAGERRGQPFIGTTR